MFARLKRKKFKMLEKLKNKITLGDSLTILAGGGARSNL
nr:MAG TPA: hypothetical protein [Caudoviricetes sp.]